jgi:hypothetical protein
VTAPICRNGVCATGPATSDPSQCTGKMNTCATGYPPATCPALCRTSCTVDGDCAAGYVCNLPMGMSVGSCMLPSMSMGGMTGAAGVTGTAGVAGISLPIAGTLGL